MYKMEENIKLKVNFFVFCTGAHDYGYFLWQMFFFVNKCIKIIFRHIGISFYLLINKNIPCEVYLKRHLSWSFLLSLKLEILS